MATDTVNGMDYSQYSQPAELAASIPNPQNPSGATSQSQKPDTDPQEIGWYFVEQYYTTLSKSPDKIHLFYNKKSQLITGTEAEKILPSVGSKAISEKIKSLDISDCKIRVLNVDSQSSFDSIVVQVIGEMSNKNQPHHKFVQTFILATQPNGYFVLNDIFRYLNQDEDEIVEDEPVQEDAAPVPESEEPASEPATTPAVKEEVVDTPNAVEKVDEKLEAAKEEPQVEDSAEEVNGIAEASVADTTEATEPTEPTESAESVAAETEPEPEAEPEAESEAAEEESTPALEEPSEPEPTAAPSPAPEAAPASSGPPAKKTWASLVGTKAAAIPALPQTQAPAVASSQSKTQRTVQTTQAPKTTPSETAADSASADTPTSQSNGWQEAGKKTRQQSKAPDGIVHAYIKNVTDKIDARTLRETLEKFGKLKYYDVSRPKQCAFVEFEDTAGYSAAVAENPHTVNGEQINVEERRPRPGANTAFNGTFRGGASAARGRGGAPQQRSGSQSGSFTREGAARGNFQGQRGSKPAGPARGRGQAQAA